MKNILQESLETDTFTWQSALEIFFLTKWYNPEYSKYHCDLLNKSKADMVYVKR